ncbi:MAG: hypothetical protein RIR32_315 [Verrucomicrobiota bacterium]|jgi:hypothetical protein
MARKLFVISALSLAFVGCMGPKKGPSPVTDGPATVSPATVSPAILVPIDTGLTPVTPVAPAKPTTPAKKSTGKLPLGNNVGNK